MQYTNIEYVLVGAIFFCISCLSNYLISKRLSLKDQTFKTALFVSTYSIILSLLLNFFPLIGIIGFIFIIQIIKYFYKIELKVAVKFFAYYIVLLILSILIVAPIYELISRLFF